MKNNCTLQMPLTLGHCNDNVLICCAHQSILISHLADRERNHMPTMPFWLEGICHSLHVIFREISPLLTTILFGVVNTTQFVMTMACSLALWTCLIGRERAITWWRHPSLLVEMTTYSFQIERNCMSAPIFLGLCDDEYVLPLLCLYELTPLAERESNRHYKTKTCCLALMPHWIFW